MDTSLQETIILITYIYQVPYAWKCKINAMNSFGFIYVIMQDESHEVLESL